MLAVETQGGRIRPRVAAARTLASALTIGAGGESVGRVGPIAQIGASLASTLGRALQQQPDTIVLMVAEPSAARVNKIDRACPHRVGFYNTPALECAEGVHGSST